MVYIVVGTGVSGAAAIIIEGQVYRGLHNFAGEVGHITLDPQETCVPAVPEGAWRPIQAAPGWRDIIKTRLCSITAYPLSTRMKSAGR